MIIHHPSLTYLALSAFLLMLFGHMLGKTVFCLEWLVVVLLALVHRLCHFHGHCTWGSLGRGGSGLAHWWFQLSWFVRLLKIDVRECSILFDNVQVLTKFKRKRRKIIVTCCISSVSSFSSL